MNLGSDLNLGRRSSSPALFLETMAQFSTMAAHGARCRLDGHACTLHDLTTRFDAELFRRFYHELLVPNFPLDDELVPWEETLACAADAPEQADPATYTMILRVVVSDGSGAIVAGHMSEFYPNSSAGLLAYFVAAEGFRGCGLGRWLVEDAICTMHHQAQLRGHDHCSSILAETNAPGVSDGVMVATERHRVLAHLGFQQVDFPYIQPPLKAEGKGACGDMLLLAYAGPVCGAYDGAQQLSCAEVLAWVGELAFSIFESKVFETTPWWAVMADKCVVGAGAEAPTAELMPLPWRSCVPEGPRFLLACTAERR